MIEMIEGIGQPGQHPLLDEMFRERKSVFVDLLRWDVPVIDGMFEVDQFDGPSAVYCVASDEEGRHLGSIRLLPSTRPHILATIFPQLCEGDVPTGEGIWELSRGCLSRKLRAPERLHIRNMLTTAVVEYALLRNIRAYSCIADSGWLSQILSLGWNCRPLGPFERIGRAMTGALFIDIDAATPEQLKMAGTYVPCRVVVIDDAARAAA